MATASGIDPFKLWCEDYYKHPESGSVPAALRLGAKDLDALNLESVTLPQDSTAVFRLSQIFRRHPDNVLTWVKACRDFQEKPMKGLLQAVWLSNTEASRKVLEIVKGSPFSAADYAETLSKKTAPDLESLNPTEPVGFHLLWSAFYATGEKRYIGKLIDALPQLNQKGDRNLDWIARRLIRYAQCEFSIAEFVVQYCRSSTECSNPILQRLMRELSPGPRTQFTEGELFPDPTAPPGAKKGATEIANIVCGALKKSDLPDARQIAQEHYRKLTSPIAFREVNQMLFLMNAQGIDDWGIGQIAALYGYKVNRRQTPLGMDISIERLKP